VAAVSPAGLSSVLLDAMPAVLFWMNLSLKNLPTSIVTTTGMLLAAGGRMLLWSVVIESSARACMMACSSALFLT